MRLRGWETYVACAAGLAAGFGLKRDFFDHASPQIVTLLSLLMAAVIPTMTLSVNSMRSSSFSVKQIFLLRKKLETQVLMLGGLFLYALMASIIVIAAISLGWPGWKEFSPFSALIAFLLMFLASRSLTVIRSVQGLLQLAGELAEQEAKFRERVSELTDELQSYQQPKDYGAPADLGR